MQNQIIRIVFILLPLYFLCSTGAKKVEANEPWEIILQKSGVILLDIQFPSDNLTGWAVGSQGRIFGKKSSALLKTIDGGNHWEYIDFPQSNEVFIRGVFFLDNQTGWITGSNGYIAKTTNGGSSWQLQSVEENKGFRAIYFTNETNGWVVGEGNEFILYKTTDGGNNWINKGYEDDDISNWWLKDIIFTDNNTGWVAGAKQAGTSIIPIIKKTIDGGETWTMQQLPELGIAQYSEISSLSFVSDQVGFASFSSIWATQRGSLLKTIDGGQTWEILITSMAPYANTVIAKDEQTIAFLASDFLWSTNNKVYVTHNGGENWQQFTIPAQATVWGLHWSEDELFVTMRNSTIMKLDEPSGEWETVHMAMNINDITWINPQKGIVTTGNAFGENKVLMTNDGGVSWEVNNQMPGGQQVHFTDENNGWFLKPGESAVVRRTQDGGNSWQEFAIGDNRPLFSMKVVSPGNIWVYGAQGALYHSTDQGETWIETQANTTLFIRSLFFYDDNTGFIAGGFGYNNGFINKTTDGGQTWTSLSLPLNNHIHDVFFPTSDTGYMVSLEGNVFKTSNGGQNWEIIETFQGKVVSEIYMLNEDYGFIGVYNEPSQGDGQGFVYFTEDGGDKWTQIYASPYPMSSVNKFIRKGESELWAVGLHNLIMRFDIPTRELNLATNPENVGSTNGDGTYHIGQQVSVSVSFPGDYQFVSWTDQNGNLVSNVPGFTYIMSSTDVILTANLEQETVQYTLTIEAVPAEGGETQGQGDYAEGEQVTLTAIAAEGYSFFEWTDQQDNLISSEPSFTFTMPASDVTLRAHFQLAGNIASLHSGTTKLFPNPAHDYFVVRSDHLITKVSIHDLSGKMILSQRGYGEETLMLIGSLQSGVYLVKVYYAQHVENLKLIVR